MTNPTQPQPTREALLGKLRRIGYLLQQMIAQEAAAAVSEAAEIIELTTPPPQAQQAVVWTDEMAHAFRKAVEAPDSLWHPWPERFRIGIIAALALSPTTGAQG